jgi:ankyrin repeat protein
MSAVQKVRRAIQNKESFEVIKRKFDEAIRIYEKYDNPYGHPIHYAAHDNWSEMITVLVGKLGCNVNLKNNEGLTPFEIALASFSFSACKTLYNLGTQIPTSVSRKTIKSFVDGGHIEMLSFVIYHRIADLSDVKKYLIEDFEDLQFDMKEFAIAVGCNINFQNNYLRRTPLMKYLRYRSDLGDIKLMLAAGADISLFDEHGHTVFDFINLNYNTGLFTPRIPKEEVLQLLTEGVSKEYQLNFEQRIKNIQYLLDKRNITLFELLWCKYVRTISWCNPFYPPI